MCCLHGRGIGEHDDELLSVGADGRFQLFTNLSGRRCRDEWDDTNKRANELRPGTAANGCACWYKLNSDDPWD